MDGGGSLANQGAHLLDVISWFMGDFESVYGEMAVMNHDIETEDIGLAIVRFKSGARGVIVGTTTFPTNVYFSAEVHGTDGGVLIEDVLGGKMRVFGEGLEERLQQIDNPIHSIIEDLVSAVEEGGEVRVDGRKAAAPLHSWRKSTSPLERGRPSDRDVGVRMRRALKSSSSRVKKKYASLLRKGLCTCHGFKAR